ncbi:MAG: RNA methyltransferase [Chitinophagaceae bacterium]
MLTKLQVKYIQSLNQKKFRQLDKVFIAEGPKIINELLACRNVEPVALYATGEWWEQNLALKDAIPFVACHELQASELNRISFLTSPHLVLGVFRHPLFSKDTPYYGAISLLLDGIQDPGNMGTIVRIADWYGIKQVVASLDCADIFNPKVVQSTMGSIARVHIIYDDISSFIKKYANIPIYASVLQGEPLPRVGKVIEGFVLVGNESKGLREELIRSANYRITIPKYGMAESLNAAVATGIILSHIQ